MYPIITLTQQNIDVIPLTKENCDINLHNQMINNFPYCKFRFTNDFLRLNFFYC